MSSVNKAIIIGRVGRDPEIRHTQNGKSVASFSVATSEKYKGEESTDWHNIVAWGTLAELCEKYVSKGMLIFVEGKITNRKWQDKEGKDRYTTEIVAFSMQFLSRTGKEHPQLRDEPEFDPNDDVPF